MRFYENDTCKFYIEFPSGWNQDCHAPNKNWKQPKCCRIPKPKRIFHWRDLEGAKKDKIEFKDLLFPNWPVTRQYPGNFLPIYCRSGARFIKLLKLPPAGCLCDCKKRNLKEVLEDMEKAEQEALAAEERKKQEKLAKKALKDQKNSKKK